MRVSFKELLKLSLYTSFLFTLVVASGYVRGIDMVPEGPSRHMFEVARSLLQRGNLVPSYFHDIQALLIEKTRTSEAAMWQDVFSITADGEVFPKHSLLSSLLLLPFIALFGDCGVMVWSVLVMVGLVASIHLLATRFKSDISWATTACTVLLGSQVIFYLGGVPYDSLGALLVVSGVALAPSSPLGGGLLLGLSVFCRPVNILYALILPVIVGRRRVIRALSGAFVPALIFLVLNRVLWGGFLMTAHQRMPTYDHGVPRFDGASVYFSPGILGGEWFDKLFGAQTGLLLFNPALLIVPFLFLRPGYPREAIAILMVFAVHAVLIFSYLGWSVSTAGNRYLFPGICLVMTLAVCVVHNFLRTIRGASGK